MFWLTGRRETCRHSGFTLRLCPICRCVRVFAVHILEEHAHVYFVPVTADHAAGVLVVCTDCGLRTAPQSLEGWSIHHSSEPDTLWEVLSPECRERLKKEAEAEYALLQAPAAASAERRELALLRAFWACEPELASKVTGGALHSAGLPMFVAAGVCGLLGVMFLLVAPWAGLGDAIALVLGLLGLAAAARFAYCGSTGYLIEHRIQPLLIRGIRPLAPTPAELQRVIERLRQQGLYIGRYANSEALTNRLEAAATGLA